MIAAEVLNASVIVAIVTAAGTIVVALLNRRVTNLKKDTEGRVERVEQATDLKIRDVHHELEELLKPTYTAIYRLTSNSDPTDFEVARTSWGASKTTAEGDISVKGGVLSIHRHNSEGRLMASLQTYAVENQARDFVPKAGGLATKRRFKVSYEARVAGGEHTIVFIAKGVDAPPGKWLDSHRERITSNEWSAREAFLDVPPDAEFRLRIDDRSVSQPNSRVDLRGLVLEERTRKNP